MPAMRSTIVLTALAVLVLGVRVAGAAEICGDVNVSGVVTSADALLVLKSAVGQSVSLTCPAIADLATCTTDLSTTNTNLGTCSGNLATTSTALATCTADLSTTNADLSTCNDTLSDTQGELAQCEMDRPEAAPLKTGQTKCYSFNGYPTPCPVNSGINDQDGETQIGVARSFTVGCAIVDIKTGLMWEILDDNETVGTYGLHSRRQRWDWNHAGEKIAQLNGDFGCGHTGWRLPNRFELETLLNLGAVNPAMYPAFNRDCVPGCNHSFSGCTCPPTSSVWSSDTITTESSVPADAAWGVDLNSGRVGVGYKVGSGTVIGVRNVQ